MIGKYKVITLCGSVRFKEDFVRVQERLTLEGNIVISVEFFDGGGVTVTDALKSMLDDMHRRKIDLSDEIFVINKGGYIGPSTSSEIEYAKRSGKKVNYME